MWILLALALLAGLVLLASYLVFRKAFYSPDKTQNDDHHLADTPQMNAAKDVILPMVDKMAARPYEEIFITAKDGLKLRGRYYHMADGAPIWIGFHGYRGTPVRDISGGSEVYFGMGHNLLLVEQRAHKGSEGHVISFGIKEQEDALCWIDYVLERFGKDRILFLNGISMGAATVLMTAGRELPENVKAVLADCPYTTPKEILLKVCGDMKYPPSFSWPLLWLGARIFGHFDPREGSAVEGAKRSKVPILLIHGEADDFVPCEMSRRIAAANPEMVEFHTFPGAGHGLSFIIDPETYITIVRAFVKRVLQQHECP